MKELLIELKLRSELLFYFGSANLLLAVIFLALTRITVTEVLGVNAWIKPFKFALSIAIYSWTMAWFIGYLDFNKALFAWSIIGLLGFEILYIALQAGRGQLSHFNRSTPLYTVLYSLMALAATGASIYTAYVGVLFFTQKFPDLPVHYLWSIRAGILLFVVFSFEGFLMGSRMSHTVGGPDGSFGLPLVNWSVRYGDLRIAHFIGMHAMQVLPLLSFYFLHNRFLTMFVAIIYGSVAVAVLVIALQGKPLIKTAEVRVRTMAAISSS